MKAQGIKNIIGSALFSFSKITAGGPSKIENSKKI
jgi:hypothetical protein